MAQFVVVSEEELKQREESEPTVSLRCLASDIGCLTRQDGSVSFSHGDTTSTAVVYGPTEVRMAREQIDKTTVEVVYKPKVGLPKPPDRKKEMIIRNSLECAIMGKLHPRSSTTIVVQETEDVGSNLACCINASCLALLDAAVSMKFMVAAVSAAVTDEGKIITDPDKKVEDEAVATMTFVFDSENYYLVSVLTQGKFTQEVYKACRDLCRKASKSVFAFYRESLEKKIKKTL